MGFSRQEYWCGLPFPPPGDLPNPGVKPKALRSPALAGVFFTTSTIWEAFWNPESYLQKLRTLLAAKADTHPGMPALHTALRPHPCGHLITAPWETSLTGSHGRTGEHCRRRISWGETSYLMKQAQVQSRLRAPVGRPLYPASFRRILC